MKAFFERVGSFLTSLRIWTVNIFTLVVLVYLAFVIVTVMRQMPTAVDPEGRVLILNPEGMVLEQEAFPAEFSFPFEMPDRQIQSRDLVKLIRAAAEDEQLSGVLIDFSKTTYSGPSTALNIASELAAIREAGKPVVAFSETLGTSSYLMAAQADEIYVHPSGGVAINGIGGYRNYYKELLAKLKINVHQYSQGDYKSFLESVNRSDMSDADRLQLEELYQPIWRAMKEAMAEGRGLEPELFQQVADEYSVTLFNEAAYDNLAFAQENGIIDGTKGFPEFRAWMIEKFGRDEEEEERETYPHIVFGQYQAQLEAEENSADEAVAVVFVEGMIQPGEIGPGVAGAHDVANLIRRAYEDEDTRALVVRVNSPGGSIIASDMIRDELLTAQARDLPVFVSMGDVAASGGFWLSTPADAIYAEPTTITGSIGVALAVPTFENSMDYLGIGSDGVVTSEHAGWAPNRAIDENLDRKFARFASSAYHRFIELVATGRDKDPDYIRSIAGGRVWIATRAQELGLVDELGNMEEAIAAAAKQAGLEDYRVNYVVKEAPVAFAFLQRFAVGVNFSRPYGAFGERVARLFDSLEGISRPQATVICTSCMVELL
jgi:protease-4